MSREEQLSHQGPLDEEIVARILESLEVEEEPVFTAYYLKYGRKRLSLDVSFIQGEIDAYTLVENIEGISERKEGETTLLYKAAREILEGLATKHGTPVTFDFESNDERMIGWALTSGREIFAWGNEKRVGGKFETSVVISPS